MREIASCELSPGVRAKLCRAGFRTVEDLSGVRAVQLAKEAGITHEQALQVIRAVSGPSQEDSANSMACSQSALELLQTAHTKRHIFAFCDEIDRMLGGGVPLREVTEFCGPPGVGKTQLGIQLCVDAMLPPEFGGLGGEAVFIDTEGSFMLERVMDIASAFASHVQKMSASSEDPVVAAAGAGVTLQRVLAGIHYFRAQDFVEQLALSYTLPTFLQQHPEVRIIVLDSVTFHFRHDFDDMAQRSRLLVAHAHQLSRLAKDFDLAMVLMNQVTTKIAAGSAYLAPALGESWAHTCGHRVLVTCADGVRVARLEKSTSLPKGTANFQITPQGVRSANVKKRARTS